MPKYSPPISPHHYRVMTFGRNVKKAIMVTADLIALPMALWSGFALRLADWWPVTYLQESLLLFLLTPILGALIFMKLGLYRAVVRFMGAQAIFSVCKGVVALAILLWAGAVILQIDPFPRSVPIIFALVALVYVGGSRLFVRNYYHWLLRQYIEKEPVLIYGAGGSGVQLATALGSGAEYLPVGYLDDDKSLWGSTVNGLPVYNPLNLNDLISSGQITHVLLALPSIGHSRRREILKNLSSYTLHVKTVPTMPEIISGESVESLRDVEPEDLLGRDEVPADKQLLARSITNKSVLVSGAGGSIGSEICRQILQNRPKVLVLYEISEYSLYALEKELTDLLEQHDLSIPIYPVLGSVLDQERVNRVLARFKIDTIYHAAAYKHVPIVEHNVFEGIRNNSFGTLVMAQAALKSEVERFILVSTDKAVRPTNIMGATKRLAELILQDLSQTQSNTIFSMVRFGNVLGSSGSVVPLFRKQINEGGPVTVTHPEITRFFMTIPEAASLVIQAGSMAEGGDVFVLDMGEPVKITDLAKSMIQLMGFEVQSSDCPEGIQISYSGLRPGEKLFEELLIGEDVIGTEHPKIMRAQEEMIDSDRLKGVLLALGETEEQGDSISARYLLEKTVTGFKPSSPIVDWLAPEGVSTNTMH